VIRCPSAVKVGSGSSGAEPRYTSAVTAVYAFYSKPTGCGKTPPSFRDGLSGPGPELGAAFGSSMPLFLPLHEAAEHGVHAPLPAATGALEIAASRRRNAWSPSACSPSGAASGQLPPGQCLTQSAGTPPPLPSLVWCLSIAMTILFGRSGPCCQGEPSPSMGPRWGAMGEGWVGWRCRSITVETKCI
jgi:hypothetical protein